MVFGCSWVMTWMAMIKGGHFAAERTSPKGHEDYIVVDDLIRCMDEMVVESCRASRDSASSGLALHATRG